MNLEDLRIDCAIKQKRGIQFYFSFYCDLAFGDDGTILRFTDSYQEFANIFVVPHHYCL